MEALSLCKTKPSDKIYKKSDEAELRRALEVLELKIDIDAKNHEHEKQKVVKEKENIITSLTSENDDLKEKVGDQKDKIRQLDAANQEKEDKIRIMQEREKELIEKIQHLEKEMTESNIKQNDEIKRLKDELSLVKDELREIKYAKEIQESALSKQIETVGTNIESNLRAFLLEQNASLLTELKSEIAKNADDKNKKESDCLLKVSESHVQISVQSPKGRNIMTQPRSTYPIKYVDIVGQNPKSGNTYQTRKQTTNNKS